MRRIWLAGLWMSVALAACAPGDGAPQPPEISYGQDLCEACGMLIDQPQLAAATIDTSGAAHKFDDIGDMIQYHTEHPTVQAKAWFVHDYDTEAWLRAESAYYVFSADLHTPMGHGLVAFESETAALAFAEQRQAQVLSFDEARAAMHQMDHASH
jgi:copper chaperone NosL